MTFANMENHHIAVRNKLEEGRLFKIARFKEVIKRTKPHQHNGYYELIFISEGEGSHLVESSNYPINVPELYFLKPGQLHCWQFTAIPKGFVLLFKEEFFDPINEAPIMELIKDLDQISHISLTEEYNPKFLFEEMLQEYNNVNAYSIHIIHGHLRSIFSKLLQLSHIKRKNKEVPSALHDRFLKLLSKKCLELHKVSEFAELLNTSPQNLNAACRKHTTNSASEHITNQLMLVAKRYILHTDMNVNEIAEILNFSGTSNFVKYFKKQEGVTPYQFRIKHFQ